MRGRRGALGLAALGACFVAMVMIVAIESSTVTSLLSTMLVGVGVGLIMTVAAEMWMRTQSRRMVVLLVSLAGAYAVRGLAASDQDWVFTLSRAAGQLAEAVLIWVMLGFPTGRLRSSFDRVVLALTAVTTTVLWLPTMLFFEVVPLVGPLVRCGEQCPANLLFLSDQPAVARGFLVAFQFSGVLMLVATAGSLLRRLFTASHVVRRTIAPVFAASILRVLALALFVGSGGSVLGGTALVLTFWGIPLSMALGLLLGRLYTARALVRLVSGLEQRPDTEELREVMADALDDPDLQLGYWLQDRDAWVDGAGRAFSLPEAPLRGQTTQFVRAADRPLAAVVHDEALLEMPTLLEAVASSVRLALLSKQALAESTASRDRAIHALSEVRRDLERNLHDGAQQRLLALQMKVSVLGRLLDQDVGRAAQLAEQIGTDLEAALVEVRALAQGPPAWLTAGGLSAGLHQLATVASVPVELELQHLGRYRPEVEVAVYYICSEALQNAAKHGGHGVRVRVAVTDEGDRLSFEVRDDGAGMAASSGSGGGLQNMHRRAAALGGTLRVQRAELGGTGVSGWVPLEDPQPNGGENRTMH